LAHEVAHFIAAKKSDFKIAPLPIWVPSPLYGLTSSITALESSPKNKKALLDFALAGPLTGMILSLLAIFIGLQLTTGLDSAAYNSLPLLPISYFQQSSLGGALIEGVLGANTLTASDPNTAVLHVHPFVIAGYAALMTNALNLTPFGRTDGGRVSLALFGRYGSWVVGFLTLLGILALGVFKNDGLLLYLAFIVFFQNELEIPIRNEADDVEDVGRILLSTVSAVLVLLTIIPM